MYGSAPLLFLHQSGTEISVAHVPLTFEVLEALKETLEHLENLRTFDPQDKFISDLKRSIRDKIAEIEERESGSMAAD